MMPHPNSTLHLVLDAQPPGAPALPRRVSRLRALALALLSSLLAASAGAATSPDPPDGEWTVSATALLLHQQRICDRIAGRVLERWATLGGSTAEQERTMRDDVLERQISDLAAARAAGDLAARFVPRARSEAGAEAGASIERLTGLVRGLCDAVALPTAPRETFRRRLEDQMARIDRERDELGRLVVADDDRLEAALGPYLVPIEIAGLEAEGEYLDYLESLRPKDRGPTIAEQMHTWHAQVYVPAVAPAKSALSEYLAARRTRNGRAMGRACRELASQLGPILQNRDRVFTAPDRKVDDPLFFAYTELRGLAVQCTAGRTREVEEHWQKAQERLREANARLSQWGLRP
ncbi:MAG: hypothetical protein AAGN46_14745 [Acidobacteriota bacterium]